jgi:alanine racemase
MRPTIGLDIATIRENAHAWQAYAGVPLRAVIKSEGYGWGFETMVRALDDLVDAFIVADVEEFDAVRPLTRRGIVTLADVPPEHVSRLLDSAAIPNLASSEGIHAAIAWARARRAVARIRIGLCPALGWSGFELEDLLANIPALVAPELEIEFWTHLTHPTAAAGQRSAFVEAQALLRKAGVRAAATDVENTRSLASGETPMGSFVRLGIGLFGARCDGGPPGVRCALRLEAPVVQREASGGKLIGYGIERACENESLWVVRCGYGDGFSRMTGTSIGILTVGMQYTTMRRGNRSNTESVTLLDADSDIDDLARAAGVAPHEIVVRLGNAARGRYSSLEIRP